MEKDTLLAALREKVQSGELSKEEVVRALDAGQDAMSMRRGWRRFLHLSLTNILYLLGTAIVVVGVVVFVGQIWEDIGMGARILITLGLGILFAALGSVFLQKDKEALLGPVFHIIGGVLIPGGVMVFLNELSDGTVRVWPVAISFGIVFAVYLALTLVQRHPVLTFFAIGNGTAFLYLLVVAMLDSVNAQIDNIFAYLTMVVGVSYLLLARAFAGSWNEHLRGLLHFFGSAGFLIAAFSQMYENSLWEVLYIPVVLGGLYLATRMKSRAMLVTSTIALVAYMFYITDQYFADSIGWTVSLIVLGLLFIGLGYGSVKLDKKYIQGRSEE